MGTLVAGVALGFGAASYVLYQRATTEVEAWVHNPLAANPGVVWSAPLVLADGTPLDPADLARDLSMAGYERSSGASSPGQFDDAVSPFLVHTPGGERVSVRFDGDRIADATPDDITVGRVPLAVLGDLEAHRTPVDLDELSPWVERAVTAMEDARFRSHPGVDPFGITRAVLSAFTSDGPLQGGSTLTQQLAKNLFLTQERTATRKAKEAFLALALEAHYSKDELLAIYLGEVYLGQVGGVPVHGVEQGARAFFGVGADSLDASQAATLAGIISSPNTYSPYRHPERARERRDLALRRMVDEGHLPADDARAMQEAELDIGGTVPAANRRSPWAVDLAIDQLDEALDGGIAAGYQVHTTIDPALQRAAERAVREGLAEVSADHPEAADAQAALVAVRPSDGAIVAMVGSRDYAESPFNRASQAWRQLGSTVKPLVFATAFQADTDLTPTSLLLDEPITRRVDGTTWTPANYDHRFVGDITVRRALETSRNIPAVKVSEILGPSRLQESLREVGLSKATHLPSAALGAFPATAVEVAGAYTVFPRGGSVAEPQLITAVNDRDGSQLLTYPPQSHTALDPAAAALTTHLLEGVVDNGTGVRVRRMGVTGPVGGKTGTTDNYRDAWFVGFTPDLVVAVWVGTDQGEGTGLSGSRAAIPLWGRFVAASNQTGGAFPTEESLVSERVCSETYRIARDECPHSYVELFREDHVPNGRCDRNGGPLVQAGGALRRLFQGVGKRREHQADEDEE